MELGFVEAFAIIVAGAISPLITAVFTRASMTPDTKRVVATVVAVFLALLFAIGSGLVSGIHPTVVEWIFRSVIFAGIVIPIAQGYYRTLKPVAKDIEDTLGSAG